MSVVMKNVPSGWYTSKPMSARPLAIRSRLAFRSAAISV